MFVGAQRKWLNEMALKGYRLVRVGKLEYEFEECSPGQYVYEIEYVGDKSFAHEQDYKEFLESVGYKVFYKNINLDYSVGKANWRPFAEKGGRISTNETTYNRELLIIEKENDGKPFELHSTPADKIAYYRRLRNPWIFISVILFLAAAAALSPIIAAVGVVFALPALKFQYLIRECKKDAEETDAGGSVKSPLFMKIFIPVALVCIIGLFAFRLSTGGLKSLNYKSGSFIGYIETSGHTRVKIRYSRASGKIKRTIYPKGNSNLVSGTIETNGGSVSLVVTKLNGDGVTEEQNITGTKDINICTEGEPLIFIFDCNSHQGSIAFTYDTVDPNH